MAWKCARLSRRRRLHFLTSCNHVCIRSVSWKVLENECFESWKTMEFGICKSWKTVSMSVRTPTTITSSIKPDGAAHCVVFVCSVVVIIERSSTQRNWDSLSSLNYFMTTKWTFFGTQCTENSSSIKQRELNYPREHIPQTRRWPRYSENVPSHQNEVVRDGIQNS